MENASKDKNQVILEGTIVNVGETNQTPTGKYCYLMLNIIQQKNQKILQENIEIKLFNGLVNLAKDKLHLNVGSRLSVVANLQNRNNRQIVVAQRIEKIN